MPVEHAVLLLKTELKGGRATNKHQLKVASVTQHFMISTHSRPIKRNPYIYVSLINYFWVLGDSKWVTVCKNAGTHWSWRSTLQSDIDIWFKIHRGGSTKNTPQKITIQKPMDLILNVAINSWTIGSCNPLLDQWKKWTKFSLRSFYLIFVVVVVLVLLLVMGGKFRNWVLLLLTLL